MKEVKAIIQPFMLNKVVDALMQIEGLPGLTVSEVRGFGKTRAADAPQQFVDGGIAYAVKMKLEIMVPDAMVETVVDTIQKAAHTGRAGDGKIFVIDIEQTVKIRTGERGEAAV